MGTPYNDVIYNDNAPNTLERAGGHDYVRLKQHDTLYGGTHDNPYWNTGNDVLSGGTGSDTMYGGTGNDTYYVDTMSDTVIELGGQGTDHLYSSVSTSYKWLPANVENVTLLRGTAYYGDGNDLNNSIYGNASANSLSGYGGNDYLYGYGGNDYLYGGVGNNTLNAEQVTICLTAEAVTTGFAARLIMTASTVQLVSICLTVGPVGITWTAELIMII